MFHKLKASLPKYKRLFSEYLTSFFDWIIYFFSPKNIWKKKSSEIKKILFVTQDPRFGLERQARALKGKHNLHIDLLTTQSNLFKYYTNVFNNITIYRNKWHFSKIVAKTLNNYDTIHYFARQSEMGQVLIKQFKVPLIYDVKDMSVIYHGITPPFWYLKRDLIFEKYCLKNAKAIVAESMECCYAIREYDVSKKNNRIYFPEYCEINKLKTNNKNINKEIRVVYAGGLMGKQANSKIHGPMQFHWLIATFEQQKIHFHVYPNPRMDRVIYQEYFDLSKENEFFHMEESIPPKELSVKMESYHFGILPFFSEDTIRSQAKNKYASSLKIFNFIEANIPILISEDVLYQSWLTCRFSAGIKVSKNDLKNLRNKLAKIDYPQMVETMREKRKGLLLENNIERLYNTYQKVANSQ